MTKAAYRRNWSALAGRLEEVTGLRAETSIHPICRRLRRACHNYSKGNTHLANAQLANVHRLIEDFTLVQSRDPALFGQFKEWFLQVHGDETFFGLRMELRMAASLTSKQVDFEKSETPDFVVKYGIPLGIECGSCHLRIGREREPVDLRYKILSAIREKSSSSFHTRPVILAIDISNLLYHEGKPGFPRVLADMDTVRAELEDALEATVFDALLTFHYSWAPTNKRGAVKFSTGYSRYDARTMNICVVRFLDRWFPKGDHWEEARLREVV